MHAIYMSAKKIRQLETQIEKVKRGLAEIGPLRPGSLTRQYRDPLNKKGPFYQLSYTHKMKSRTEYVRSENLATARKEVAEYKKYKKLNERFIDLSIELSTEVHLSIST